MGDACTLTCFSRLRMRPFECPKKARTQSCVWGKL
jgi:hypothetical protein